MSADQMRKMLEQLMGPQDEQAANRHFSDSDVCRPFLLGICLHDLFTNTREDLGACSKIHSEAMRGDYEKASQKADYNMEEEVLEYLMDFISKNEKRIVSNKKRLEAEESPELEQKAKEIHEVGIQIGEKLAKAEALGNDGKVDESLAMMAEVEQLKRRRKQAEDDYRASLPLSSNQQQKLRACDVCGAFLSLYDNDRRTQRLRPCEICGAFLGMYDKDTVLADHFGGKLHLGFVAIREKIAELEEKIKAKVERRRSEREVNHSSEDRRGSRRSGASRRSRSRDRDQDRDRVRDRDRDRERDRDKDRERDRDRDRDRDRERRSHRSRSRERSRRNRSRSRDRDRHRRSRSRSRERRRRSRSRSRERRRRSRSQEEKSRHRRSRS